MYIMAGVHVSDEESVDLLFQGQPYNLSVTVFDGDPEDVMAIDMEDLTTGESWSAELSSTYIESITSKTGSFKRFGVLVKMLLSAMRRETDTVALDLLTYADLEVLKSKKTGKPLTNATAATNAKSTKRYLILTYVVEFDRVHYPLPLAQVEGPTVTTLQRQVRRLRREVSSYRRLAGLPDSSPALSSSGLSSAAQAALVTSVSGMQREIEALRQRNTELSGQAASLQDSLREANSRLRAAQEAAAANDAALEKLRQASRAEVKRLRAEINEFRGKLGDAEGALASASEAAIIMPGKRESEMVTALKETNEQLRGRVKELTRQLTLVSSSGTYMNQGAARGPQGTTTRGPGSVDSRRSLSASSRVSTSSQSKMAERLTASPLARPYPRAPSVGAYNTNRPTSASSVGSRASSVGSRSSVGRAAIASNRSTGAPSTTGGSVRGRTPVRASAQPYSATNSLINPRESRASTSRMSPAMARQPSPSSRSTSATAKPSPYLSGMNGVAISVNQKYREHTYAAPAPAPAPTASQRPVSATSRSSRSSRPAIDEAMMGGPAPTGGRSGTVPSVSMPEYSARHGSTSDYGTRHGSTSDASTRYGGGVSISANAGPSTTSGRPSDNSGIAEIDARLEQLQAFLKAAKAGSSVLPSA